MVHQVLREECHAFAYDDKDVGCIPSLNMHIALHDVRKTYTSVPKPLHQEVKDYLQDLLNRGWISESRSPYSSPIVCVRKKSGELRLCCDYRELNQKSVPVRHPIPTIQDMLDSPPWQLLDFSPLSGQSMTQKVALSQLLKRPGDCISGTAYHLDSV